MTSRNKKSRPGNKVVPRSPHAPGAARGKVTGKGEGKGRGKGRGSQAVVGLQGTVAPFELGQSGATLKIKERALTVSAGVPGDRLLVRLDPRVRGLAHGEALIEPSIHRVEAPCALLERCGGCSIQAMDYRAQLRAKSLAFRSAMAKLGCPPGEVQPVVGLASPLGHRTKLMMPATSRGKRLRFGLNQRGSARPTPAEGCPVQHPLALGVLAMAQSVLDRFGVLPSDLPKDPRGWLHALRVRVDPTSGQSELTLCGRTERVPGGEPMLNKLRALPSVTTVALSVCSERSSYPMVPPVKTLAGRGRTTFTLGGQQFELSPGTFFQTSAEGAELLAQQVLELLPQQLDTLADLYAGAGIFTCLSHGRWQRALVLEESQPAMADLRRHARLHKINNVVGVQGKAEVALRRVLDRKPEVVLLDPPRAGCKPGVLEAVAQAEPRSIVYVSCGFNEFIDGARRLEQHGYRPAAARAVDMFPHTTHLETVVRFERA